MTVDASLIHGPHRTGLSCTACGHDSLAALRVSKDLAYDLCPRCGLCTKHLQYENARKDFEAGQVSYYEQDEDPFAEPPVIMRERMARRAAVLKRHLVSGDDVLEIGPGGGQVAEWFRTRDCQYVGCELSRTLADRLAAKGVSVRQGEFEKLDFGGAFDLIVSFHTIEHVPDPKAQISKAFSVIKPGGKLIIATPNARSWEQRMMPRLSANFDIGHLHVFSPRSLRLMAESAGWRVESWTTSEYTSDWLRIVSKVLRRVKGEDESTSAGKYSRAAASGSVARIISVIAALTRPFRTLQARLKGGNEIIIVLRRPNEA